MKAWKTSSILIATLLLGISLAACNNNSNKNTNTPKPTDKVENTATGTPVVQPNEPVDFGLFCDDTCSKALTLETPYSEIKGTVAVIVNALAYPYGAGEKNQAEIAHKKYFPNMKLIIGDGAADPVVQTRLIDDYIARGIDILVLDPVETDAMVPAAKRARDAGIKVILMDRYLNGFEGETLIKASDVEEGRLISEYLAGITNGKAKIAEITGPPAASNVNDRSKGFNEALKSHPDMKVISVSNAEFDRAKSLTIMQDLLNKYKVGELDAVYSHSDHMTIALIQAIKAAGRTEIKVVSIDGMQDIIEHVRSGAVIGTSVYPVPMPMALFAAAKLLAGEEIPKVIDLSIPIITKENVDKYDGKTGF